MPLCRFNYCAVAAMFCFSQALRGGQRFRRSTTVAWQPKISSRLGSARNQNNCRAQTLRWCEIRWKESESRRNAEASLSLRSRAEPQRRFVFPIPPLIFTFFFLTEQEKIQKKTKNEASLRNRRFTILLEVVPGALGS